MLGGLHLHVFGHFGVRKDEEPLFDERVVHEVGDLRRLEHGTHGAHDVALRRLATGSVGAAQHRSVHALRAQAAHGDAARAVRDRKPLGERDSGVLGDGIWCRADLCEHSRGAGGGSEVTLAGGQPLGHQVLRGPAVRVHVDVERDVPLRLRRAEIGAHRHSGVGEEQVDASCQASCLGDQSLVLRFSRHVGDHCERRAGSLGVERGRECFHVRARSIAQDNRRAGVVKSFTKCRTDAAGRAGHHRDCAVKLHSTMLRRTCVSDRVGKAASSLSQQQGRGRTTR